MTQDRLPMEDPIESTTVEFHARKGAHYRKGKVRRALDDGNYEVVEVVGTRRGSVTTGRTYRVPACNIRCLS